MSANTHPLGHKLKISPAQVLQKVQEMGVALSLVNGKLNAAGEREAVQVLAPLLRQHRNELVELLAESASDQAPPPPKGTQDTPPRMAAKPGARGNEGEAPDWHALDKAYQLHHVNCPVCQAAGRGARYGLRCGTGAALWSAYSAVQPPHFQWMAARR